MSEHAPLTCGDCADWKCDNSERLRTDKACDRFKPFSKVECIQDPEGSLPGNILFTRRGESLSYTLIRNIHDGTHIDGTEKEFNILDKQTRESIIREFIQFCDVPENHVAYVSLDIEKVFEGVQKEQWWPRSRMSKHEAETVSEQPVIEDIINAYSEEVRTEAEDILKHGDPAQYISETIGQRHLGDESLIWSCIAAGACLFISNTRGLHVGATGDKGTGKSDGFEMWAETLPPRFVYNGSMSAKSMFYDEDAMPRTVRVFDDVDFNDDQINTIKKITSHFQKKTQHSTVVNGKNKKMFAPERQVMLMNSVNGVDDDQLLDRFLLVSTQNDPCHLEAVANCILGAEIKRFKETDHDIQVCRCMIDILSANDYEICIPYIKAINLVDKTKLRNIKKFIDIVRSCCLYRIFQREERNGVYFATLDDFDRASWIYSMSADSNATQLTKKELEYLGYFIEQNRRIGYPEKTPYPANVTITQMGRYFEVGKSAVRKILHGKNGNSGLTGKVQIHWTLDNIKVDDKTSRSENFYQYYGGEDFSRYSKFASIDHGRVDECTAKFFEEFDRRMVKPTCHPRHRPVTHLSPTKR